MHGKKRMLKRVFAALLAAVLLIPIWTPVTGKVFTGNGEGTALYVCSLTNAASLGECREAVSYFGRGSNRMNKRLKQILMLVFAIALFLPQFGIVQKASASENYFLKVQTTGGQQWDGAQIDTGASGLNLVAGTSYTFSYDLYTPDQDVAGIVLQTNGNYNWIKNTGALSAANPAWTSYTATYTYLAASGGQLQFVKTGDSGATDTKNITYYIDNFVVKDAATGNVVYTANFDDKSTDRFASNGSATLSIVNSTSAATTPTLNPDVLSLPSIKNTYPNYLMGSIIGPYYMQDPIMSVMKAQFGVVTPENATKPASLIGTSASTHNVADLSYTEADKELQSAIDNGLKIHGHTLVWQGQSIPWLNNDKISDSDPTPSNPGLTAAGAYKNMNDYINAVLTHFDGKFNASTQNIVSWDVVNEAMAGTVRDSSLDPKDWHSYLKSVPWLKATDDNYVEQAFKDARAAEPNYNVLLYYNDYSMDDQNKAAAIRDMVKDINDRWAVDHPDHPQLIQGVGMQEHNGLGTNPNNTRKTIQMFKDIGVKVSISELDISAGTGGTQTADQKTAQAAQYARLMQVYTDPAFKDTVQRITFWGLTDTNSWLSSGSPLLFDGQLYPKDSFYAVIDPAGYLANYKPPGKPAGKTATAAKGTPNIDGKLDDIWNTATPIDINVTQPGNTKADTHMPAATARMLWDNGNLYVLAQVTKDPSEPLDKGNANPWEQDSVEVVVDLTNGSSAMYSNASGHYRVRYDGFASVDAGMTDNQGVATKMTSATKYDEMTNSYTVEMQIPFIQITPAIGTQIGFDAQVNDAKAGARIGAYAWNDATGTAYQDLFKIGTLQLVAGADTVPPVTTDNAPTGWQTHPVNVVLQATDADSGVAFTYYSLDGGDYVSGNSVSISSEGVHTLRYYSEDQAGNKEAVKEKIIQIDLTAPKITMPDIAKVLISEALNYPIAVSDATSGLDSVSVTLDGKPASNLIKAAPLSLTLGIHPIVVTASDKAGNSVTLTSQITVYMDTAHLDSLIQCGIDNGFITAPELANSLLAKVKQVQAAGTDAKKVGNALNALSNEVSAQSGKGLKADYAALVQRILKSLGNK